MIGAGVFVAELEHQHHDWSFGQLALANVMLRQFPAKGFDDLKGVRSADGLASPFDQCDGVVWNRIGLGIGNDASWDTPLRGSLPSFSIASSQPRVCRRLQLLRGWSHDEAAIAAQNLLSSLRVRLVE
jgi:hypothetical protein